MALLAAVVAAALHFSEGREFVTLAESAQPAWLVLALALPAATYLAQGEILRAVGRAGGFFLSRRSACELSLAKLFLDQAVPFRGPSFWLPMLPGLWCARRALPARGTVTGQELEPPGQAGGLAGRGRSEQAARPPHGCG